MPDIKTKINVSLKNPWAASCYGLQRLRRLTKFDFHFFKRGYCLPPELITLYVTDKCNLHCEFCSIVGRLKPDDDKILSFSEIINIIDQVSFFKPVLYLMGGEPLLRKEIFEI